MLDVTQVLPRLLLLRVHDITRSTSVICARTDILVIYAEHFISRHLNWCIPNVTDFVLSNIFSFLKKKNIFYLFNTGRALHSVDMSISE